MEFLSLIAAIIVIGGCIWQAIKDNRTNETLEKTWKNRGELYCPRHFKGKTFNYHLPTGKKCNVFLHFDQAGKAYNVFTSYTDDKEILGGQYCSSPQRELSISEVKDLIEQERNNK